MATPSASTSSSAVQEPFPIFKLAHQYLLYDVNTISHVREKYNITGVLIGTLPQAPQQNVFLGIPLELLPEEARLLVEKGVAFIEDDVQTHKNGFLSGDNPPRGTNAGLGAGERAAYQAALRKQGQAAANQATKRTEERKKAAMDKLSANGDWNDIPEDMLRSRPGPSSRSSSRPAKKKARAPLVADEKTTRETDPSDEFLFASPANSFPVSSIPLRPASKSRSADPEPFNITPATSYPPLVPSAASSRPPPPRSLSAVSASTKSPPVESSPPLPDVSASYPLFRHLHAKGYFISPGLRFGCQYTAYPGDPLRFHSHFLCNGMEWDEEFDLLSIVGGGRLGTGVKKGFLIGGAAETDLPDEVPADMETNNDSVRTFCIEWGGM